MLQLAQNEKKSPRTIGVCNTIQTTLYDLIEAVNETVFPVNDRLVAEVVVDILESGHARSRASRKRPQS